MQIEKNKVVSFHYRLYEVLGEGESQEKGELLEESHTGDPMVYLHGHRGMLVGLEEALDGKATGDSFTITLSPEKAYGHRHEDGLRRVPIKHLLTKGKLKADMVVSVNTSQGPSEATIVKVGKFNVDIDANNPLAGKTLTFDVEVTDTRDATAGELSHGHVHGVGGHHH